MTKKERMYQRIEKHGADLNRIFNTDLDNITLCKRLRRLEAKAHKLAEDYCNGVNGVDSENWDDKCEPILEAVNKIIHFMDAQFAVFVNGDARGYALKIDFGGSVAETDVKLHKDWGGYGILAPDFFVFLYFLCFSPLLFPVPVVLSY